MDAERLPVIVGVGQINDRPADPLTGLNPVELMAAALRQSETDAGASLIADADFLGVVKQIAFREIEDVCAPLTQQLGITPAHVMQSDGPNGDSPIMLLNEAALLKHSLL